MIKLTSVIKRMLNAITYEYEAEYLPLRKKWRILAGGSDHIVATKPVAVYKSMPQIGLYMGSELPSGVMTYVIRTCSQRKHGLAVFTFQSEASARSLLIPYLLELEDSNINIEFFVLSGEPPSALIRALRKHVEIVLLVCNEFGYMGRSLLKDIVRQDVFPVPVVMVVDKIKVV